jgi:hypothetical protein
VLMTAAALLSALRTRGFRVTLVGEQLRVQPGSALPDELQAALRARKAELAALLQSERKRCAVCWRLLPPEALEKQGGLGTWWRCREPEACARVARRRTLRERLALRRIGLE